MVENSYTLTTLCDKDGKYTVTLTLSDKSTAKITIYNYPSPVFTVKVNGKEQYLSRTSAKECKVSVDVEKGYTIKKLEYAVAKKVKNEYGYSTEESYKTFKSGGTIPINKLPWTYKNEYKSEYDSYSTESIYESEDLFAYTYVKITYKDKYTNEELTTSYGVASVLVP